MSVVIGCDSFLAFRNVRNGDLVGKLGSLTVLVDPHQFAGSQEIAPSGVSLRPLLNFNPLDTKHLGRLITRAYFARKGFYDPATILNEELRASRRRHPRSVLRRAVSESVVGAMVASGWLRGLCGEAQRGRRRVAEELRRHPLVSQYHTLFRDLGAMAVVGFSPEGYREILLVEAAKQAGLPTGVMIRSRDNLAAKILHLPDVDLFLVWSQATRDDLLQLYPETDPEKVVITGSPQFDHHLDPRWRLDRTTFFDRIGLDPDRPLVVYSMAMPELIPHEGEIVQFLADAAHEGRFRGQAQLLVRGHPRIFGSDARLLKKESPEARQYPSPTEHVYRGPEHEAGVVRRIIEDEPMHLATLAFQDVQVNVCGTMTVDAAILGKPTVNVFFDVPRGIPARQSVRRFYRRSDVRRMMRYGASRLARSPRECIDLINMYLENPGLDSGGRRQMREEDAGPLDGKAGERVAERIASLAERGR